MDICSLDSKSIGSLSHDRGSTEWQPFALLGLQQWTKTWTLLQPNWNHTLKFINAYARKLASSYTAHFKIHKCLGDTRTVNFRPHFPISSSHVFPLSFLAFQAICHKKRLFPRPVSFPFQWLCIKHLTSRFTTQEEKQNKYTLGLRPVVSQRCIEPSSPAVTKRCLLKREDSSTLKTCCKTNINQIVQSS